MQRVRDLAALIGRLGVGAVFIAHGWQKFTVWGLDGTAATFGELGVPAPALAAWFAAILELGGGALLVLGAALPLVGVLLAIHMACALFIVHLPNGLFVADGGFEHVLVFGVAALALGFNGGAFALDRVFFKGKTSANADF